MKATTNKIDEKKLNESAEELLVCFPEHVSELLHELAEDYQVPIWQTFCGVVLEVYMQGNLSNLTFEPAWMEGIKQYDYTCKHCGKNFKPINIGQKYCCNDCGIAAQEGVSNVDMGKHTKQHTIDDALIKSKFAGLPADKLSKLAKALDKGPGGWEEATDLPE